MNPEISIQDKFNPPLLSFPAVTLVKVNRSQVVEIPTAEVFQAGDWLSPRFAGVKFYKIQAWLQARGHVVTSMEVLNVS